MTRSVDPRWLQVQLQPSGATVALGLQVNFLAMEKIQE